MFFCLFCFVFSPPLSFWYDKITSISIINMRKTDPILSTIWCLHLWTLNNSSSGKWEPQAIMSQGFLRFSETLCHLSLRIMVTGVQHHVKDSAFDWLGRWSLESLLRSLPGLVEGAPSPLFFQHLLPLKSTIWSSVITVFLSTSQLFHLSSSDSQKMGSNHIFQCVYVRQTAMLGKNGHGCLEGAIAVGSGKGQGKCLLKSLSSLLIIKQYILNI